MVAVPGGGVGSDRAGESSAPVGVVVCAPLRSEGVKVSLVGISVSSPVSEFAMSSAAFPDGARSIFTVNIAISPPPWSAAGSSPMRPVPARAPAAKALCFSNPEGDPAEQEASASTGDRVRAVIAAGADTMNAPPTSVPMRRPARRAVGAAVHCCDASCATRGSDITDRRPEGSRRGISGDGSPPVSVMETLTSREELPPPNTTPRVGAASM